MRVSLQKGKQKELINLAKDRFTWRELSIKLDISEGYLRNELRKEQRLLSEVLYRRLGNLTHKNFDKFIIKKLDENWGKIKGGRNSKGRTKEINIPEESEKLAEFYGIMLGDGNSYRTKYYKSRTQKRGVYSIKIIGDSRHDKEYFINYVKPLIESLFEIVVRSGKFKPKNIGGFNSKNGMFLGAESVQLVSFLEKKGFKPGNKIKNKVGIPKWIKNNKRYLRACLRGIFDTDGSIYKLTNQSSIQINFTNYNIQLLEDVFNSLIFLGINPSKISMGCKIYITKRSELRKFLKLISFSNYKHLKKVKKLNLDSPIV